MIKETKLTHSDLIQRLNYNAEDGTFIWTSSEKNEPRLRNTPAGSLNSKDRTSQRAVLMIVINGERWAARQLAWYWMTGEVPQGRVKPKDGNAQNIRFENLEYVPARNGGERHIHCGRGDNSFFIRKKGQYYGTAKTLEEAIAIRNSFPELCD